MGGAPLEWCAGVVAAVALDGTEGILFGDTLSEHDFPGVQGGDIIDLVDVLQGIIFHTDLLSLVDPGQALDKEIDSGESLFGCQAHLFIHTLHILRGDVAADAPGLIVVFDDVGKKTDVRDFLLGVEKTLSVIIGRDAFVFVPACRRAAPDSFRKVKHGGEIALVSDEGGQFLRLFIENFADGEGPVGLKCTVAHLAQEFSYAGGLLQHAADGAQPVRPVGHIVAERKGLFDVDDGVDPETGKPLVQPPVDHGVDFFADFRVLPVEIGLFPVKDMQIEPVLVPGELFPDRTAEIGTPVAGQDIAVGGADGVIRLCV